MSHLVLNIGARFDRTGKVKVKRDRHGRAYNAFGDKASRRMLRRKALKANSSIEGKILAAQRERSDAREASDNSHAARRLLEREAEHRRGNDRATDPDPRG